MTILNRISAAKVIKWLQEAKRWGSLTETETRHLTVSGNDNDASLHKQLGPVQRKIINKQR